MNWWSIEHWSFLLLSVTLAACGASTAESDGDRTLGERPELTAEGDAAPTPRALSSSPRQNPSSQDDEEHLSIAPEDSNCLDRVPVYIDGESPGDICPRAAVRYGLTVVDLSDSWAPSIFNEAPSLGEIGRQPYREIYVGLADEQFEALRVHRRTEQYLELFGIFPTFRVIRERLAEAQRHSCHDTVDDSTLEALTEEIRPLSAQSQKQRRILRHMSYLKARLEREVAQRGLTTFAELRSETHLAKLVDQYEEGRVTLESIAAMQEHLKCDGYLSESTKTGMFDGATLFALRRFQRRHMIVSAGYLDEDTRRVLLYESEEADFISALRALRERVADAAGLIEDGSARHEWDDVLGRELDSELIHFDAGQPALAHGARDAISAATEAAARGLGWTSPESTLAFLEELGEDGTGNLRVALRLPPVPEYHSEHMDLHAIVDRGDVYYELGNRWRRVEHRPIITLYTRHRGREIPLIRWATTIGGWQPENTEDGGVGLRYKNSPPGDRIWRDVIASPAWLPPPSTPSDELVVKVNDAWVPKMSLFGPGYRSAYGLVMMMLHKVLDPPMNEDGTPNVEDEGIRAHGSVSYRTIDDGYSHGCHRLYNHLAVRLAAFSLRHRNHTRHGQETVDFRREVEIEGETIEFSIDSRGYRYELTPPVPVEVLEGNILGPRDTPSVGFRNVRYPEPSGEVADGGPSSGDAGSAGTPAAETPPLVQPPVND